MDNFNVNSFFESEAFTALDDESKSILKEFTRTVSEKSQAEAIAAFMECREKLNVGEGKQKALIEALKAGLSPENRIRLEVMENFMKKY